MNFIDAHKIVHDYAGVMDKGADKNALLFRPLSYLPFQDKDKVVDAYKIFYSHMIFYNTRTQEQYEQYDMILGSLKFFVPDDIYKSVIKLVKKNKMKEATTFMSDYMEKPSYRIEEVEEYFNTMIDIKKQSLELFNNGTIKTMDDLIYNYCIRAYQHANIEYKDEYYDYFFKFDAMRDFLDKDRFLEYYARYRSYIESNQ